MDNRKNMKPVVVYVSDKTRREIDAHVKAMQLLAGGIGENYKHITRSSFIREVVEQVASMQLVALKKVIKATKPARARRAARCR